MTVERLKNYVGGAWIEVPGRTVQEVRNPATGEVIALCPMGGAAEVDAAAKVAHEAYASWRRVPAEDRVQCLFKLKALLEEHAEEIAATVTRENGKTLPEARGSVRRGQ